MKLQEGKNTVRQSWTPHHFCCGRTATLTLPQAGHGPDFPTDKDLTEFYQQGQWLGKGQAAEAPKASSTSKQTKMQNTQ